MNTCCTCGKPISSRDGRLRYTDDAFKKHFRTGDRISGWSTGLTLQITAIGKTRVLLWDERRNKERTALQSAQHGWVLVDRLKEAK